MCVPRDRDDADVREVGREAADRVRRQDPLRDAAVERQRPDRHRERRQAEARDEEAVERAEDRAEDDGRDHRRPDRPAVLEELGHAARRVRPSIDATDRSISPVTTSSVSGSAMIAISPTFRQMKKRFVDCEEVRRDGRAVSDRAAEQDERGASPSARTMPRLAPRLVAGSAASSAGLRSSRSATGAPSRAQGRRHAHRDQAVEGDRADEQRARDGLAPEGRHVHDDERAVDRVQEQRAERGAENGAAAAEDRDAADDDGGDDLELVADAGDRVDRAEVATARALRRARRCRRSARRRGTRASRRGCRRGAPRPDPSRSRRSRAPYGNVRIAYVAIATATMAMMPEVRHPEHRAVADLVEALGQHRGVDLVAAGPGAVDAADDVERSERDNEAGDARDRDDRAVDDPARRRRFRARAGRRARGGHADGARRARRSRRRRCRAPSRSRGRRCA